MAAKNFRVDGIPSFISIMRVSLTTVCQVSAVSVAQRASSHTFHDVIGQSSAVCNKPVVSTSQISASSKVKGVEPLTPLTSNTLFYSSLSTTFSCPQTTTMAVATSTTGEGEAVGFEASKYMYLLNGIDVSIEMTGSISPAESRMVGFWSSFISGPELGAEHAPTYSSLLQSYTCFGPQNASVPVPLQKMRSLTLMTYGAVSALSLIHI